MGDIVIKNSFTENISHEIFYLAHTNTFEVIVKMNN